MAQLIAFLRAVNVGGNHIRMGELKGIFEKLKLANVSTFIASGNVAFESNKPLEKLTTSIETALKKAMEYDVTTFLRTRFELAEIPSYTPFPKADLDAAGALSVGFLQDPPDEAAKKTLASLETDIDRFHAHGSEIYWLCTRQQSESKITNGKIEKRIGQRVTFRNAKTIVRMAAKFPAN